MLFSDVGVKETMIKDPSWQKLQKRMPTKSM